MPVKNGDGGLKITLKGELTIQQADEIREKILDHIAGYGTIEIQAREVTAFDLAFYQLLTSLKQSLKKAGVGIRISLSLPAELEKLFFKSGLDTKML